MSVLAFKALGYGAEQIPDKFFEKIPGGYFKPEEEKKKSKKSQSPAKEKSRRKSERSRRERSPRNEYSDYSSHDSEYEAERRRERRRRKSTGRSTSRSSSRGKDVIGEDRDRERDMAYAEQGHGQEPYFPPPPTSEYAPYNPQEHASRPSQGDYRPTSAQPQSGYPPQVNNLFRSRSATVPMMPSYPTPANTCPPLLLSRPSSNAQHPFAGLQPHLFDHLRRGTPISASFSPSYEPPLAAVLRRPPTNTPQPTYNQAYPTQPPINRRDGTSPPAVAFGGEAAHRYEEIQHAKAGQPPHARSASAARYTPGPGYAPSPADPIPPPPVGVNSPPAGVHAPYAPYNPATYAPHDSAYPPGNDYASPPPFYRQQSRSQPSFDQSQHYPPYNPRSSDQQVAYYDDRHSPSRRSSTKHDRREHRHRARSADSRSSRREKSRMSDMRERFDDMDLRTKNLGATVAGALAGGFAGRAAGKSRLTMLAGAAAGALGGQAMATRNVDRYVPLSKEHSGQDLHGRRAKDDHGRLPSRSRSRSRQRRHDDRDRSSDRKKGGGLRARSRSIIDRFRSKSRGRDDRDRHHDSESRYDSDERRRHRDRSRDSRRPDRGYKVHEEYDYFTESDSEGDGSPVVQRRKKTVKKRDY